MKNSVAKAGGVTLLATVALMITIHLTGDPPSEESRREHPVVRMTDLPQITIMAP